MRKTDTAARLIFQGACRLDQAGSDNARGESAILLAYSLGITYHLLLQQLREEVPQDAAERFWLMINQRCAGWPLQYLTKVQEFMSLEFEVNEAVLVPRWDTERLVEQALAKIKEYSCPRVVDVGTGSGAIVVSLAKYFPQGRYFAVDISQDALEVARKNACRHQVDGMITFIRGDLLGPFLDQDGKPAEKFDFIVSNLPYIPSGEISHLPRDVLKEPILALDGGKDGLNLYRVLISQACRVLNPGGCIFLEIGCEQGQAVSEMLKSKGFKEIRIEQDYGGRDRVVSGCFWEEKQCK